MYLDTLMQQGQALEWGLCGIDAPANDRRIIDTLRAQDGLYTLDVKHPDGHHEPRVISSVVEAVPPTTPRPSSIASPTSAPHRH